MTSSTGSSARSASGSKRAVAFHRLEMAVPKKHENETCDHQREQAKRVKIIEPLYLRPNEGGPFVRELVRDGLSHPRGQGCFLGFGLPTGCDPRRAEI